MAGRFDAGIRVGERLEKDMIAVRLTPDVQMTAVASPDYLKRHGVPKTPPDLHRHVCINWRFPGSGAIHRWGFEKRGKRIEISVEGAMISNHQGVVVEGALQGLGIHYAYDDGIHDLIARGLLKRVLADWSPTVPGPFSLFESASTSTGAAGFHRLSARPGRGLAEPLALPVVGLSRSIPGQRRSRSATTSTLPKGLVAISPITLSVMTHDRDVGTPTAQTNRRSAHPSSNGTFISGCEQHWLGGH